MAVIVERTEYWALPGKEADVLIHRKHASAVRESMGLIPGTIRTHREGTGPTVSWQATFPDEAAHAADQRARNQSEAFGAVRDHMNTLISRFERIVEMEED